MMRVMKNEQSIVRRTHRDQDGLVQTEDGRGTYEEQFVWTVNNSDVGSRKHRDQRIRKD